MILRDFLPDPKLEELVQCYRIAHFDLDNSQQIFFKAYPPKPEVCLHFILYGNIEIECKKLNKRIPQFPVTMIGQQTSLLPRYNTSNLFNFQIVFQPTAVFLLTGIPAYELTDSYYNAEDIFPHIRQVLGLLQEANSYNELLSIANRYISSLADASRYSIFPLDTVANRMIKRTEDNRIDSLARESFLCTKQFERNFYERVGVNPKTFARIIRFNKAFNTKNANPSWDWLRVATACDYFDYQHLVKDYKHFTELTPNAFHLQEQRSPECLFGLAEELYKKRYRYAIS